MNAQRKDFFYPLRTRMPSAPARSHCLRASCPLLGVCAGGENLQIIYLRSTRTPGFPRNALVAAILETPGTTTQLKWISRSWKVEGPAGARFSGSGGANRAGASTCKPDHAAAVSPKASTTTAPQNSSASRAGCSATRRVVYSCAGDGPVAAASVTQASTDDSSDDTAALTERRRPPSRRPGQGPSRLTESDTHSLSRVRRGRGRSDWHSKLELEGHVTVTARSECAQWPQSWSLSHWHNQSPWHDS